MARVGSFTGATVSFGAPLSVVKPIDNFFPKYDPEVAAATDLTEAEKADLQRQLDELHSALVLARDL